MADNRMIRRARPDEADDLTELTVRSKAYWGYDADFMEKARPSLVITREQIRDNPVYVLEESGSVLGYYSLEKPNRNDIVLESLFIVPEAIQSGAGARLLGHALDMARTLGFRTVTLDSDPNAEGFYRKMSAERIGERPGATPGRFLPVMRFDLHQEPKR